MDIKKTTKNFAKHILYFVKNHKAFFPPDGKQKILIEKLRSEVMRSSIQKVYKEDVAGTP